MRPCTTPEFDPMEEVERVRNQFVGYVAVHLRGGEGRYIRLTMRTDPSARVQTDGKWKKVSSKSKDQRKADRRELQLATFAVRLVRPRKGRVRTKPVLHVWLTRNCNGPALRRALASVTR